MLTLLGGGKIFVANFKTRVNGANLGRYFKKLYVCEVPVL